MEASQVERQRVIAAENQRWTGEPVSADVVNKALEILGDYSNALLDKGSRPDGPADKVLRQGLGEKRQVTVGDVRSVAAYCQDPDYQTLPTDSELLGLIYDVACFIRDTMVNPKSDELNEVRDWHTLDNLAQKLRPSTVNPA